MPADTTACAAGRNARQLRAAGSFVLLAVACLTIMVGCVIVPGLPSIAPALGVGAAAGWLVTLPSLGVVIFGALSGRAIERLGAHRALCVGLVLYGVLGLAAVGLHGPIAVFADRILLGGATALVMASGTMLISSFFSGHARLTMIARQGMAIELGGVIFLSIGGFLTRYGWAAPFGLYAMAFVFLALVLAFVPRAASTAAVESDDDMTSSAGAIAPVLVAAFSSMIVFFTAVIMLPFSLSRSAGLTEAGTGYFLSGVSLVAVCFAGIMPMLARRIGERATLIVAFLSYGCGHILFMLATGLSSFLIGGVLVGAGFGLSMPLANHMTVELSPAHQHGRSLANLSMAIFLGQFLASPLQYAPGGPNAGFVCAATIAFAAALFGLTPWTRSLPSGVSHRR